MRRADRLFQLVQCLRARRFATGQQLADAVRVSRRTVYRDIQDLITSGVPIRGEAGVGYTLDRGYDMPPLTFTAREIEALVLGARIVSAWGGPELAAAASTAMTKVEAVLPEPLRQVLLETPLYAPDWHSGTEKTFSLPALRQAIGERRVVEFAYVREDGESSTRRVRPLALYFWGTKWTLASFCELRRDYRSFRPDRMTDLEITADRFDESDGVGLEGFLARMDAEDRRRPD